MIFLQLRAGNSGPAFQGVNQNDTLLWDTTERKFFVGPGGGAGGVTSWNLRTGPVVPVSGDYDSDQVDNASGVAGASTSDALDTLSAEIAGLTSDDIANASGVAGASTSDALDTLGARATITTKNARSVYMGQINSATGTGGVIAPGDQVRIDLNTGEGPLPFIDFGSNANIMCQIFGNPEPHKFVVQSADVDDAGTIHAELLNAGLVGDSWNNIPFICFYEV